MFQTTHTNDVSRLGTANADRLLGGKGDDYLNGYAGNDRLFGHAGNDRLFGGSGNDWLDGGSGNDQLFGGSGNDQLFGDSGDDRLDGGSGYDCLFGGKGADILIDYDGGDRLTGDKGNDQFWIGNGSLGMTEIVDFQIGHDRLKLLDTSITYDQLQRRNSRKGTIVSYQGHDLVRLNGIKPQQLTANQFDFGNAQIAQDLQKTIQKIVQDTGTPGATAFVTFGDGTTWTGATGFSDLAAGKVMQSTDRFNIASITKPMTSTVIFQLVQEGKLTLNDTLNQWLPDIAKSITNGSQITIKELLAHTSGIPDFLSPGQPGLLADLVANPALGIQPWPGETILSRYIYGQPAIAAPGQAFSYSNTNYLLLGKIIETATHSTLEQQFQSRIFEPLGMQDSFYKNPSQVPGGTTHGYLDANEDGKIDPNIDVDTTAGNILDIQNSAGGVISTAADINRFTRGLLNGELISPDRLNQMKTGGASVGGLGIASATLPNGEPVFGASGRGLGWSGQTIYLVNQDITVTVFTNSDFLPTEPDRQLPLGLLETIGKAISAKP